MGIDALAIVGMFAVPAVLALHWLRRRFPPRVVSALFLFADVDRTTLEGSRRDRLRTSPSFWLELLAAAIFSTLLLLDRAPTSTRHHVFVLDGTASLRARVGDESTFERIRSAVRARVDAGDRVTLIESGSPPSILLGPAASAAELGSALERFDPWRVRHDPLPALDLARGLAAPGRVTWFTDRAPRESPPLPDDVEVVALGRATQNVGFLAAARGPGSTPEVDRIEVTIGCFADPGTAPMTRRLGFRVGESADAALPDRELVFEPGERKAFSIEVAAIDRSVELTLSADALGADDRVSLAPRKRESLRIAASFDAALLRELGFESGRGTHLDRLAALLAPASVVEPSLADLVFATRRDENVTGDVVILPLADLPSADAAAQRRALVGPFLVDRSDPLTEGLVFENVIWTIDPTTPVEGVPLVSAGNLPLFTQDSTKLGLTYRLAYDPRRSNMHLAPDWPILLVNVAEATRARLPGLRRTNLALGDDLEWRSPFRDAPARFTLVHEAGKELEYEVAGALVIPAPAPPGLWRVRAERIDGTESVEAVLGVALFDRGASDLTLATTMERDSVSADAEVAAPETTTTAILALLLVLLVLADAWVLRARKSPSAEGVAA